MARLFDYDELKRKYETIMDSVTLSTESYDYIAKYKSRSANEIYINDYDRFDIFLSHSYRDKDIIPYIKKELESMGILYVDGIVDKLLNRDKVPKGYSKRLYQKGLEPGLNFIFGKFLGNFTKFQRWNALGIGEYLEWV